MIKFFAKLFMPKPETLARYAADAFRKAVNESGKAEQIARYGSLADKATEVQKQLTEILKDGKVDEKERDDIAAMILPLFQKLEELI